MSKPRQVRIDKKKHFPLRINESNHNEARIFTFRRVSLSFNEYYQRAIDFAQNHEAFHKSLEQEYKVDDRRGHFTFHSNKITLRRGRLIE